MKKKMRKQREYGEREEINGGNKRTECGPEVEGEEEEA